MTYSHPSPPSSPAVESSRQTTAPPLTPVPAIAVPDEDTFSRTILVLAPEDLTWLNPSAIAGDLPSRLATSLAAVEGAIVPLLDILAHLRSPQGDWPADLAWTPANLYPYVADEVCEVLEAYQSANAPPLPATAAPSPSTYWTLQDLAPRLLWAIARSRPALMNLLSGVTAAMITPQGDCQEGLLRLVVILAAMPTEVTAEPWVVDLAVQRPPVAGIAPDQCLQVGSLLPAWGEGTAAQLLTQILTQIAQDQPSLAPWFQGVRGDWLAPGANWRSGTLVLQCSLEFISLPTWVTATTRGSTIPPWERCANALASPQLEERADHPEPKPSLAAPRSGVAVPLDLADLNREEGDTEGETTILFLDDDEAADADLMPPFPASVLPEEPESLTPTPTSVPPTDAPLPDQSSAPTASDTPAPPPEMAVDEVADNGTVEAAADSSDPTVLTIGAMFPDLPWIGTAFATGGPIARVRGPRPSTSDAAPTETLREQAAVWREAMLRSHLLTHVPTWQRSGLSTPDGASARMSSDAEPEPAVLAILETACAIVPYLAQPESGLFLPVLDTHAEAESYALNDWLQGLFWSVTRSTYSIAQLMGGVYAQVLLPEQGWQTGTLRLVVLLTIRRCANANEAQQWVWDLGTRQLLTTAPPWLSPDAVVCVDPQSAYPTPIRLAHLQAQLLAQLRASEPRFAVWEAGLPIQWQATEATETTAWQSGQWHLTCNLELVATP